MSIKNKLLYLIIFFPFMAFAQEEYTETSSSFNSAKILGMGNTFVASAEGLESFKYNPAGLTEDGGFSFTFPSLNLVANMFQLNDDLVEEYNSINSTNVTSLSPADISFIFDSQNRDSLIKVLLAQATEPYLEKDYANGLGGKISSSVGYAGHGFGVGLLFSVDSEMFGSTPAIIKLKSDITTEVLLGYGMEFSLFDLVGLSAGASVRPMYRVKAISALQNVLDYLKDENSTISDLLLDMDYMAGYGIGLDLGVKANFFGLNAGISVTDIGGTKINYSQIDYDLLKSGTFIGSSPVEDIYKIPAMLNLGIGYNPNLGKYRSIIDPSLGIDFTVPFIPEGSVTDYALSNSFWSNVSAGADIILFNFMDVRAGLNGGYFTAGLGFNIFAVNIDFTLYSEELGNKVGDRQQMGAVMEFVLRM